jgi:tetratricopeptide (TPR) repeat protein
VRLWAVLGALAAAGCGGAGWDPAPEEIALDRLEIADALFEEGRWAEAEPEYAYVVKVRDRIVGAWLRLAECRERQGRPADAAAALRGLLRVDPGNEEGRAHLARLEAPPR